MKHDKLTPEQEAKMLEYRDAGIKIAMSTHDESMWDVKEIESICQAHRVMCGVPLATKLEVFDSPMAAMRANPERTPYNALYGNLDISWIQMHMFYYTELGIRGHLEKVPNLYRLALRCGWMWMDGTTTCITKKPIDLHFIPKPNGIPLLHNTTGMAIKYADGDGIYCLNGLEVPAWLITEPYNIDRVMGIENVEIRNEALKLGGPDVLEKNANKKILHKATMENGGDYELYEVTIGGNQRRLLKGNCPSSSKTFNEYVPPNISTVQEALQWREWGTVAIPGLDKGGYLMPSVRT
jgi:hypothetical protein